VAIASSNAGLGSQSQTAFFIQRNRAGKKEKQSVDGNLDPDKSKCTFCSRQTDNVEEKKREFLSDSGRTFHVFAFYPFPDDNNTLKK